MRRTTRALYGLNVVFPIIVILSVWVPVIYTYKDPSQLNFFRGADALPGVPDAPTLTLLKTVMAGVPANDVTISPSNFVTAAQGLLRGHLNLAPIGVDTSSLGRSPTFHAPFDGSLIWRGNSSWQLAYSGFLVPHIFIRAYDATGKDEFLSAARDFILGWWNLEATALMPRGFLWNDHAISSRAVVLCEFWYRYRKHAIFNETDARAVVALVENTARLLARKSLYTYRTNHGFMQNVGLAKIALSFPGLENGKEYKDLAFQRIQEQLRYFFSEEGIVLEHSIGYHVFGLKLLDASIALAKAAGHPIAASTQETRRKGLEFLRRALRPDGTLARVGDTLASDAMTGFPLEVADWSGERADDGRTADSVAFGKSGYAFHRTRTAHLTAFWGYLPHMGHKHADELSIHLWAGGVDWWTAVGYWPYTRNDRDTAICWDGSNAPHFVDEPCRGSKRISRIRGTAHDKSGFALDLFRKGPDGFRARRQILSLPSGIWLILDSFSDIGQRQARIVWLTGAASAVKSGAHSYRLRSPETSVGLDVQFLGSAGQSVHLVYGDTGSTIGWIMDRGVRPAPALVLDLPSHDSWSANVSVLEEGNKTRFAGNARMVDWRGPVRWKLLLPLKEATLTIERSGTNIMVNDGSSVVASFVMTGVSPGQQTDATALQSYKKIERKYGKPFKAYTAYRLRMTWMLAILAGVHYIFILCLLFVRAPLRLYGLFVPVLCWPTLMIWLFAVYFVQS